MRNLQVKALREGRHGTTRVHVEPRRRPTKEEILEEALMQDQLLDEAWDDIEREDELDLEDEDNV
jgi:hypothetical protein